MKFAAAFLLICLASSSYQVQPRAHYIPLYYADGMPAGYDIVDWAKAAQMRNNAPVKRILGNLLPSISLSLSPPITLTSTATEVVTSTVTTAAVVNCIPTSLFSDTAAGTSACTAAARRRRDVEEHDEIEPSEMLPVETSAIPEITSENKDIPAEITSSKTDEDMYAPRPHAVYPRAGTLTTTKVVTVTSTTVTFVPTTITSTRLIAASAGLLCLPNGYAVCA